MMLPFEYVRDLLNDITPQMAYNGADFTSWQESSRKKLAEILGMQKFSKVAPEKEVISDKTTNDIRTIEFSFNTEKYYRVNAKIYLSLKTKNAPVAIMLPPHSPGCSPATTWWDTKPIQSAIIGNDTPENMCIRAVEQGFTAISIDLRDECFEETMINHLMGRTTIGERVWDVKCLLDIIESDYSDIISTDFVACMGEGNSGLSALYAGVIEDRIKLIVSSNAVSSFKELAENRNKHCACEFVPQLAKYFKMDDVIKMAYPKYYVQVNSTGDVRFDISDTKAVFDNAFSVYKNMGAEDKCKYIHINGERKFHADKVWKIVDDFIK